MRHGNRGSWGYLIKPPPPPPPPPPYSPRPTSPYDRHLLPSWHSEAETLKDGAVRVIAEIDIFKCDGCVGRGEVEYRSTGLFL